MTRGLSATDWGAIFAAASSRRSRVDADLINRARDELIRLEHMERLVADPEGNDGTPTLSQSEWWERFNHFFADLHCSVYGRAQGIARPDDRNRVAEEYANLVTRVAHHKPGTRDYD